MGSVFMLCTRMQQCFLSAGARRPNEEGCSHVHARRLKTFTLVQQRVAPLIVVLLEPVVFLCVSVAISELVNGARLYDPAGKVSGKGTVRHHQQLHAALGNFGPQVFS